MIRLSLKRGAERRIKSGSLWVFSNEVANRRVTAGDGELVEFSDSRGNFVGRGYYNHRTLIAGRILTRRRGEAVDSDFFVRRIKEAVAFRRRSFETDPDEEGAALRVVHGEGDRLPGLVVDRFGPVVVVQIATLGMLRWIDVIAEALIDLLEPEAIVLRTDVPYGDLESVESGASVVRGVLPDAVVIEIDGSRFHVDPLGGQKTGFYLDQSDNRSATAEMAAGRRVLDMYTYTGAFAVACARGGAEEVLGVDSSASAVETACLNARLNGVTDVVSFEKADAVTTLRRLASEGRTFDMVILDPPPFAPNRRSVDAALRGYKEINLRAFRLLRQGGVLVTSACSHHVCRDDFISTVRAAASDAGVEARVTGWGQQPADHPVLLGMPETEYLSCAFLEVC